MPSGAENVWAVFYLTTMTDLLLYPISTSVQHGSRETRTLGTAVRRAVGLRLAGLRLAGLRLAGLCIAWFLAGMGVLAGPSAHAQSGADVEVIAETNGTVVGKEDPVLYTLRVRGVSPSAVETPEPPATTHLVLDSPTPSTNRKVSFQSGKLGQTVSFQWSYRPMRVGIARLRAVDVVIDGTPYTTEEIRVRVVPQAQSPLASAGPHGTARSSNGTGLRKTLGADDLFIRVATSTQSVYQNEQATVSYRLFFRPGIRLRHSRLASAWDANGFWREELDVASRPVPSVEQIDGESYRTIVLKRVAVFPTRTGTLRIDPLQIETEAYAARSRPPAERYSVQSQYEPVTLSSDPLTLDVKPLPERAPASFHGAVGQFDLDVRIPNDTARVGGAVNLTLRVRGRGNIATLQPPTVDIPGAFEVYDPKIETNLDRGGTQIRGTKTFSYVLVPRSNGRYVIPDIELAYFNPETADYTVLRSDPMTVHVTGDAAPVALSTTGAGLPVGDIAGIMEAGASWTTTNAVPLYLRVWPYAVLAIPLLIAGGLLALARPSPPKKPAALDAAHERLTQAEAQMQAHEPAEFYATIEQTLFQFLRDRTGVPVAGFSRERLDAFLRDAGVDADDRQATRELLDTCDRARFAPDPPSQSAMQVAHRRATMLIRRFDTLLSTSTPNSTLTSS